MSFEQRKLIAETASLFGNLLFVSDDVSTYNNNQKDCFINVTTRNKADINYVNMDNDGDISIKYTLDGEKKGYCFNINSGDKKVLI